MSDVDNSLNTTMYLANLGSTAAWWKTVHQPQWKTYMQAMYSAVNTGCGQFMQDWIIAMQINMNNLTSADSINTVLLPFNQITNQAVLNALYDDPWYGLNNWQNYPRWQVLAPGNSNLTAVNEKLAWQGELRQAFGLDSAQVQALTTNWNNLWTNTKVAFNANIPSSDLYLNTFGVAYWQWATGMYTEMSDQVSSIT